MKRFLRQVYKTLWKYNFVPSIKINRNNKKMTGILFYIQELSLTVPY